MIYTRTRDEKGKILPKFTHTHRQTIITNITFS